MTYLINQTLLQMMFKEIQKAIESFMTKQEIPQLSHVRVVPSNKTESEIRLGHHYKL